MVVVVVDVVMGVDANFGNGGKDSGDVGTSRLLIHAWDANVMIWKQSAWL